MKLTVAWGVLVVMVAVGCAVSTPATGVTSPQGRARVVATRPQPASIASALTLVPQASSPPAPLEVRFERVLALPVSSIALGEGSRVGVLSDVPYVGDARGLHALPLPSALRPKPDEHDDLRMFFGRDNEPRIMGTRHSSTSEASIYWRHTAGVWRDGREEIGQLGGTTRGGLWGVLGSADPELVCRANAQCIIKRTTGWTTAPAGSAPRFVELVNGVLWGLDGSGLANITAKGWSLVMPAPKWTEPRAFWAVAGESWVAAEGGLFHYRDGAWTQEPAPVFEPAAFWGTRFDSLWIVGKGGAARFDGHDWRSIALPGPFSAVVGRNDEELWLGGEAGLVRVKP